MTNQLTITAEKVKEAASKCAQAKSVLQTLFPKVFEDETHFDLRELALDGSHRLFEQSALRAAGAHGAFFEVRHSREYAGKAFYLSDFVHWELMRDSGDSLCLVPTKL